MDPGERLRRFRDDGGIRHPDPEPGSIRAPLTPLILPSKRFTDHHSPLAARRDFCHKPARIVLSKIHVHRQL